MATSKYLTLTFELNLMTNKQQNRITERRGRQRRLAEWRVRDNSRGFGVDFRTKGRQTKMTRRKEKKGQERRVCFYCYIYSLWSPFLLSTFPFLESVILSLALALVVVA